jgi:hypothetical protein
MIFLKEPKTIHLARKDELAYMVNVVTSPARWT